MKRYTFLVSIYGYEEDEQSAMNDAAESVDRDGLGDISETIVEIIDVDNNKTILKNVTENKTI
tara:strand:+ start:172 stop:360 length:189 start_codon:yes stop_codon:yes gene_type:complete